MPPSMVRRSVARWLAILALSIIPRAASAISFSPPVSYPAGGKTVGVAVADLDENGWPDLVVGSLADNTISVLLGQGNGVLGPRVQYNSNVGVYLFDVADLNDDGHLDLVGTFPQIENVGIFLGDGAGHLSLTSYPAAGLYPRTAAVGDLDDDDLPDIATSNVGTTRCCFSVALLRGTGEGTFEAPFKMKTIFPDPSDLVLGDFDEDGSLDVVYGRTPGTLHWHHGNGDGTISTTGVVNIVSNYVNDIDAADLNHDGHLDLALAGWPLSAYAVLGNGDGTFGGRIEAAQGGESRSLAVADFDLDGNVDLADCLGSVIQLALGNGDGTFQPPMEIASEGTGVQIEAADMNRDGRPDLVVTHDTQVSVLFNQVPTGVGEDRPTPRLSLEGVRPNPALGDIRARFALRTSAPATLSLVDLMGRVIETRDVGFLGPGRHAFSLGQASSVRPGVYWLRLTQGNEMRTARAVILR